MAFNPDQYLAKKTAPQPEFNPDLYLKKSGIAIEPAPQEPLKPANFNVMGPGAGLLEKLPVVGDYYKMPRIAAESALSSMTMGLTDPLISGVEALGNYGPKLSEALANKIVGNEAEMPSLSEEYKQAAEMKKRERADSPFSSMAGSLAGAISPVGALSKTAGLVSKGAKALAPANMLTKGAVGLGEAATVGALGGAQNYGEQKIQSLAGTLDKKDVAPLGGQLALGSVAGIGGKVAGKLLDKSAQKIIDFGKSKAAKAVGYFVKDLPKKKGLSYSGAKNKLLDIGETAIEADLIKPGANVEKIAEQSEKFLDDYGKQIGQFYKDASKALSDKSLPAEVLDQYGKQLSSLKFNPSQLADDIEAKILMDFEEQSLPPEIQERILGGVKPWIDQMKRFGKETDIQKLNNYRKTIDSRIKWAAKELPEAQEYLALMRQEISNDVQSKLNNLSQFIGGDKGAEIKKLNKLYGQMSEIARVSKDRALREEFANRAISPSDYITGVGGSVVGGISGAVSGQDLESTLKGAALGSGLGLVNRAARKFGPSITGPGAYSFGKNTQAIGKALPLGLIKGSGLLRSEEK